MSGIEQDKVIKKLHPHPLTFIGFFFGGILLAVVGYSFSPLAILLGISVFVVGEILRRADTFYVLENGVAKGYKLIGSYRHFAEYKKIQNITVDQTLFESLFGIGSIHFDTAGSDKVEVVFSGVSNPYKIEKLVREKMALP